MDLQSDLSSSVVTVLQQLRSVSRSFECWSDYPDLAGEFDEEEGEYDG